LACGVALLRRCVPDTPIRARVLAPLAAVALGIWTVDALAFDRIVRVQAQSMEAMRTRDWSPLRGHTGIAWDVGYLAYSDRDLDGRCAGLRPHRARAGAIDGGDAHARLVPSARSHRHRLGCRLSRLFRSESGRSMRWPSTASCACRRNRWRRCARATGPLCAVTPASPGMSAISPISRKRRSATRRA